MTIAIGCDHSALPFKQAIIDHLTAQQITVKDLGTHTEDACDYPDIAKPVCDAVNDGSCDYGILICGTGIGISMSANKVRGIRCALCHDYFSTKYTRLHNDSNIIAFGARVIGTGLACELVDVFLSTDFEGGRHATRVEKMMALEG